MQPRKRLSDIVGGGGPDSLAAAWDAADTAADFAPLPAGKYLCRALSGELFASRSGTPGYKLTLEIREGEHSGRRIWHDLWLTTAAMPMAKRDLAKIGVVRIDQLERPLPSGILLHVRLSVRRDDDGTERNRVVSLEPAGTEPADPFAPGDAAEGADVPAPPTGGAAEGADPFGPPASTAAHAVEAPPPDDAAAPNDLFGTTFNAAPPPTATGTPKGKRSRPGLPPDTAAGPYGEGR